MGFEGAKQGPPWWWGDGGYKQDAMLWGPRGKTEHIVNAVKGRGSCRSTQARGTPNLNEEEWGSLNRKTVGGYSSRESATHRQDRPQRKSKGEAEIQRDRRFTRMRAR